MAMRLSADEWLNVADFAQEAALSHICHATWSVLQGRHLVWNASTSSILPVMDQLTGDDAVHTLNITFQGLKDDDVRALGALKSLPSLRALTLVLDGNAIGNQGCENLPLKWSSSLTTLTLDLSFCLIGDSGVQWLAGLSTAPALTSVTLHLPFNLVRDAGAKTLVALKDAPALKALAIGLEANEVGDSGAEALAALKDAPCLTTLTLDLEANRVGDAGSQALVALKDACSLTALNLNLACNLMTEDCGRALERALVGTPSLMIDLTL